MYQENTIIPVEPAINNDDTTNTTDNTEATIIVVIQGCFYDYLFRSKNMEEDSTSVCLMEQESLYLVPDV